ncbi:MAG: MlaD family protein [Flavicella sp.]
MMKISRELKTGLVALMVIILFIWGFNYLKGYNLFNGPTNTYFTKYANVQGLNTASVVTVNGYTVGKIINISFDEKSKKPGNLLVEFSIDEPFSFSKNSIAKIYSASLMGGKSLAIVPSFIGEPAVPGDFLTGEIESDIFSSVGEKLNPLQAKLEKVIVHADSLLMNINNVLDSPSRQHIRNSLASMDVTMANLQRITENAEMLIVENRGTLKTSIDNVEHLTENFSQFSDSLAQVNVVALSNKINSTIQNLNAITKGIENGEGTVGKLVKDPAVYDNLEKATKELAALLEDVKLHPKRYVSISVFGKKEKEYVAPTEE